MKVGFVSLGCSKNLVDTEMMIGLFKEQQYEIENRPEKADIIVINTCGFIQSAKEEAIDTIFEMAKYKKEGNCKFLIVTGCLVERYQEELKKEIPEVDLFLKYSDYAQNTEKSKETFQNVFHKLEQSVENKKLSSLEHGLEFEKRMITTGENFAYLRIAEGCSNRCTYCAIPNIRGPFVSRTMEDIIEEAELLANKGITELIVIAQDTSKYGIDIYGKPMLAELLYKLEKIEKIKWIRFLYTYPETITEELIQVVKNSSKICHYFDIPIQHISDRVLKRMNRKSKGESIRKLITTLRNEISDVIIRTTVMVGFPGETEEDFQELYQFVEWAKLDKLGAFMYSKEENTPAERLKEQIHPMTKKKRYCKIMELQKGILQDTSNKYIGQEVEVLVEGTTFDKKYDVGRSYMDVPEIDGIIYIKREKEKNEIGNYKKVKIVEMQEYDKIAQYI